MISIILVVVIICINQTVFHSWKQRKMLIFGVDLLFVGVVFFVGSKFFDLEIIGLGYGMIPQVLDGNGYEFVSLFLVCAGFITVVLYFSIEKEKNLSKGR